MAKHIKSDTSDTSGTLLSLVLFVKGLCNALWKMGYEDALSKESEIKEFFRKKS